MGMNWPCDNVKHYGIIESIKGNHAKIRISRVSACVSCKASSFCCKPENKDMIVDVHGLSVRGHSIGDNVLVVMNLHSAYLALLYGYAVPLLILLTVLFTVHMLFGDDLFVSFISLASIIPYYMFLYTRRAVFHNKFSLEIVDK